MYVHMDWRVGGPGNGPGGFVAVEENIRGNWLVKDRRHGRRTVS